MGEEKNTYAEAKAYVQAKQRMALGQTLRDIGSEDLVSIPTLSQKRSSRDL